MSNYPDQLDNAAELADINNQSAIDNMPRYERPQPTGHCYQCDIALMSERALFCGGECSTVWSRENEQ
jgi:hypothetical protein